MFTPSMFEILLLPTTHCEGLLRVVLLPFAPTNTYNRGMAQHVVFDRVVLAQRHECSWQPQRAMQTAQYKRPPTAYVHRGRNCTTRCEGYGSVLLLPWDMIAHDCVCCRPCRATPERVPLRDCLDSMFAA